MRVCAVGSGLVVTPTPDVSLLSCLFQITSATLALLPVSISGNCALGAVKIYGRFRNKNKIYQGSRS